MDKNYLEQFRNAMSKNGLHYGGALVADGQLHRVKCNDDHERNSWYVLYPGNSVIPAAGAFGCWKRGFKEPWCSSSRETLTSEQWQAIRDGFACASEQRERAEIERRAKARKIASRLFVRARPVLSHSYLSAKRIRVFGDVRTYKDALVIPLRDENGAIHSLQFVGVDGTKRFLSGGQVAGCFFTVSDRPDGALVLCEGYATGASIAEASGLAVVCAMNAGNLLVVAKSLRKTFPEREIIVSADDDTWTPGNPGLLKATEAARAIGARLAVATFKDTSTKPTDFNDLAALDGLAEVKRQIEAATLPKESDDELLQRLAALSPLEYERAREAEADKMGCRTSILDRLVDTKRSKRGDDELQGRTIALADITAWPESVGGADVLSEVANVFSQFVVLPSGAAEALALWCAHTHGFTAFTCSPRLNISSPEKGCGKTTLRDTVSLFVPRPLMTENMSVAVLFRVIQSQEPTVLADEYDAWLRDNEELRGILNAGHRRGGQVFRCEGESNDVRGFNVFAPAVLCGIGSLPETLRDRSIVIRLERAKPGELRKRFDSRRVERETELCRKLARFMADNRAMLESCDPKMPERAFNRLADNWRPLFAIAEIAGGDWPQRASVAFDRLTSGDDSEGHGTGTELLADIRQVFVEAGCDRIFSKALIERLCAMTDRPWPEVNRGKPASETWLARKLHSFGIASRTLRIGNKRAKGYERADFIEQFDRYLPSPGISSRDDRDIAINAGISSGFQSVTGENHVTGSKLQNPQCLHGLSRCHASNAPSGQELTI